MTATHRGPLIAAATLLGVGLGGFVDGILFHQILQLHNMVSARYPTTTLTNDKLNMFWDGLFHAFTWTMTVVGLALLWRAVLRDDVPNSTRCFLGGLALGAGLFNLVEGLIDHHLLRVHFVIDRPGHLPWDLAFLASGAILIGLGVAVIRSAPRRVS